MSGCGKLYTHTGKNGPANGTRSELSARSSVATFRCRLINRLTSVAGGGVLRLPQRGIEESLIAHNESC